MAKRKHRKVKHRKVRRQRRGSPFAKMVYSDFQERKRRAII